MDHDLIVRRWRRYGADRLYVTAETGAPVGSIDLQSGKVDAACPSSEEAVRRAGQAYLRADLIELVIPAGSVVIADLDAVEAEDSQRHRGATVRARLRRLLDDGWHPLAAVPVGRQGTTLDHLVIGPGGVWTVSERSYAGRRVEVVGHTIQVDGVNRPDLREARLEAARVQAMLRTAVGSALVVRPMVVIEADVLDVTTPTDVMVVGRPEIPAVFRAMPLRLEPDRAAAIATVARRPSTWGH